ncbi:kinesin-like protein unc-104, partial [Caerostris extrusa]
AVQERLRDQEQEKQERLRLEEILNLCAEYEEQTQKERNAKLKVASDPKDPASSSSSGEFSSVSTDSSVPASTNSSNNSQDVSSKSDSNIEGYSSEDSKDKILWVYCTKNGYYTVPNRIKTNGSLPRERGHTQVSPLNESQTFDFPAHGTLDGLSANNGATTFVNHKALNSASSEDELCAILGNSSISKLSPTNEHGPSSPYMGTAFLTYPHSPRTRIKTVAGHHDKGPEVYENKHAVNEMASRKNLTLTLPETNQPMPVEIKHEEFYDSPKYSNANYQFPNQASIDLDGEFNKLQKEKQRCLEAMTTIKHKVSELDCQKNEVLNELQLEHAFISGELKDKEQLQIFDGNKLADLQSKKANIEKKSELVHQELEAAKLKIQQQEKMVEDLQNELKAFEDLEFQQLEFQAHEEDEKDKLTQEIECFKETISQRQIQLSELNKQKQTITSQMEQEQLKCDNQLKLYTDQLRQEISNLEMINSKLKTLINVKPSATPCSSPESSPRTSESDMDVQRNGTWNISSHGIDNTVSMRQQSERGDNCNSFHSFESESSSLTSSDTGLENGRRSEDKTKAY